MKGYRYGLSMGRLWSLVMASAAMVAAQPQFAQAQSTDDGGISLKGEVQAGAEYDSNVSVDDLDTNTGLGDWSAVIDARASLNAKLSGHTDANLAYDFSQSLHEDFTEFDLQSHMASADISHDFGKVRMGGAYRFIHAQLGGDDFLTMHQLSPYASLKLGKAVLLRADYSFTDKNFAGRIDRDAKNHAGAIDAYYFINGSRSFLLAGYKYTHENANDAQYDYDGHSFKLRLTQKFAMGKQDAVLRLGWRHERRDYDGITPSILAKRKDRRHRLQADLEVPVSRIFFVAGEYEYGDYKSNLPSADFRQNVFSIKLGARF